MSNGVIAGDVDAGQHQRGGQLGVDELKVGPEPVRTVLAAGGIGREADLIHSGPPATGGGDVHGMTCVEKGPVGDDEFLGPEASGGLGTVAPS